MNLIVDIGNSFIKLAILDNGEIKSHSRNEKVKVSDITALYKKYRFERVIVSSVRKKDPYFVDHLIINYDTHVLSYKSKLPINNLYKTPKTLGKDRLAAVVAANHSYPNKNCLVIDIGTCIKYDYIDKLKNYHGGNIAPGVQLRLKSMHHFTSALPLVAKKWNAEILGVDTKSAIQNGAIWGIKLEIESFIKTLTQKMGSLTVILTGGGATYFGEIIESKIFVDSNLLLLGLEAILDYN